jgi:nucleotide-binding universal stress UspA family protein
MFKHVLVPLDLTDKHGPAVTVAAELAGPGGEITLLHVVEVIPGLAMEEEKTFYSRLERLARAHLEKAGGPLTERKIPWKAKVLFGDRAREVVEYAQDAGSDLIVLTAPKPDPQRPAAGWGSLSWKVGFMAQRPVLLVKS